MNIKEYISSGILESYVMDLASYEERMEVENLLSSYPELKLELEKIEKALNLYVTEYSESPPAYLKGKIISGITGKIGMVSEPPKNTLRSFYPIQQQRPSYLYWTIAASILLLISIGSNVYLMMESRVQKEYRSSLNKTNNNLTDSLQHLTAGYNQVMSDVEILKDPMYKIVELKGLKASPDAKAMVCWCPMEKKVYVEIDKLPPAPRGMQYQLWAIVDGKPVSEGMLTLGRGLHRMPDIDHAQAFAVTLEREGGSPTPKGDMYVMGSI